MSPYDVDDLGYPVDPKLREIELRVCSLASHWRGNRDNPEAQRAIVLEYEEAIKTLYSLGWDGELDVDCILPEELMPAEYVARNPHTFDPLKPNAFVSRPHIESPSRASMVYQGRGQVKVNVNDHILQLVEGDITDLDTDAIVNAANDHLILGSGVAGAIRRRGGPTIQAECNRIGGCPVGKAAITTGGNLLARHVIHAVGPHGGDRDADALLGSATRASLELADANHLNSIAFPAISTGVFGYPMESCAEIMLATTIEYLEEIDTNLDRVVFCLYGEEAFDVFKAELRRQFDEGNEL